MTDKKQVRARARDLDALASAAVPESREPASVVGEPSDEEWAALVERAWDKYKTVGYYQGERFMYDSSFDNALEFVRRELARYGHQPAPPAEGEVGELVLSLRETAAKLDDDWYHASARIMRSAATLLQQLSAPAPVVVPDEPAVPESREPASVADHDNPIQEALNKLEEYDQANPYHDCRDLIAAARAVLARWGHQPARLRNCPTHGQQPPEAWGCPDCVRELREELAAVSSAEPTPPTEGEVGELVAWLLEEAEQAANSDASYSAGMLTWAAQVVGEHAELPVPVSEGLPEPEAARQQLLSASEAGLPELEQAWKALPNATRKELAGDWWESLKASTATATALAEPITVQEVATLADYLAAADE